MVQTGHLLAHNEHISQHKMLCVDTQHPDAVYYWDD